MQELLTPVSKLMGEREDYFDLWTQVKVTDIKKTKRNGVFVVEYVPVLVNIGCEFLDEGFGFKFIRQNLGTFTPADDLYMYQEGFGGLGRGCNIAAWSEERARWELFFGNCMWNKKEVQ